MESGGMHRTPMRGPSSTLAFFCGFYVFMFSEDWRGGGSINLNRRRPGTQRSLLAPFRFVLGQSSNNPALENLQVRYGLKLSFRQGRRGPAPADVVRLEIAGRKDARKRSLCECMKRLCFSNKLLSGVKPELLFRYCKAEKRVCPISKSGIEPSAVGGHTPFLKSLAWCDGLIDCADSLRLL